MKKLILLNLSLILLGCNNTRLNSKTVINNSYITNVDVELAPHSIPIKKQILTGRNSIEIKSNLYGLFESYKMTDLNILFDYDNKKYTYTTQEKVFVYKINLDNAKNVVSLEDLHGNKKLLTTFDNQGRVIKVEDSAAGNFPYIFITQFHYENDVITKSSVEMWQQFDNTKPFPIFLKEKQYFYNNKKQLSKSVNQIFSTNLGSYRVDNNNQKIADKQENCFYENYNQQGDWTKLHCLDTNKATSYLNLRTLEYY